MQAQLREFPEALGGPITASYESIKAEFFRRFNDKKYTHCQDTHTH